ncbi:RIN4 pathogenic type III effector avirulence factor Avr cleavage site domain-containing protein [Dioscorea alata]|uniref:RIN4 pathogenic type III effector avirulence factor Avr cleavage site domain-containing protein n=1 Tax=Dioscorea alata TaxID=55571 RepID=A0ACB7VA40_DIOAL|nr:RIN4 pathogenic type III effector avirulence factor Avr cleavage site domain-containing protein [Dioscorea alata]
MAEQQQQQGHVPKYGDWESGEQELYTAYFENARKGRNAGRWINPNDPQQKQQPSSQSQPTPAAKPQPEKARNALKEKHVGYPSREEEAGEVVGFSDSPARKLFDEMPQRGKGRRMSAGSDRSVEQSPLHPHHQYQQHGRSPRAGPGHGIIPHTPPRTRMRQGALPVLDREDSGSPVPRFGGWDEKDPATTENYTELFGNIRQERETSSARAPITDKKKSSHLNQPHYNNSHSKGCSCFGWLKN